MGNEIINVKNGLAINSVVSRQAQEVQGASYTYPRGGQKVSGPSIRLAEAIAQCWGNIDYGVIELNNSDGLSEMMAYAWDLETNVRRSMIFSVKHERDTKNGKIELTDNRDIYEITANMGARRVRACILGVIPADIVDKALSVCDETIKKGEGKNLEDSIKNMLKAFDKDYKVSRKMIEGYIGYSAENFDINDLNTLRGVFNAIKDGSSKREDYFKMKEEINSEELLGGGEIEAEQK